MSRDLDLSCARFERQLRAGRGTKRADCDIDKQVRNYRCGYALVAEGDQPVREVLNQSDVPLVLIPQYLNFARRVAKLCARYTRLTRRHEVMMAVSRWQWLGLSPEVLKTICRVVFDVDLDQEPAGDSDCAQRQVGQQACRSDGRPDGTEAAIVPERR